jgi:hypothetical protein
MIKTILCAALLALVLFPVGEGRSQVTDNSAEPNRFYREFVGLTDEQIREIREGKAVRNILSKLGAKDRTHAATIGLKRGIIEI